MGVKFWIQPAIEKVVQPDAAPAGRAFLRGETCGEIL